jgi:predicted nucleic acid-binding protein
LRNKTAYSYRSGIICLDALHIVAAEKGRANYLITCDDKMVEIYKRNEASVKVKIVNILEFVLKEVK